MIEIFIKGPVVPLERARHTKSGHVYTPAKSQNWKEYVASETKSYMNKNKLTPFDVGPLQMDLVFTMYIPKADRKKELGGKYHPKKPDSDNLTKGIKDALEGVCYKNDSQVARLHIDKIFQKTEMGVLIKISQIDSDEICPRGY